MFISHPLIVLIIVLFVNVYNNTYSSSFSKKILVRSNDEFKGIYMGLKYPNSSLPIPISVFVHSLFHHRFIVLNVIKQ